MAQSVLSKRMLLGVAVLTLLVGVGTVVVRWQLGPGVTWANYQRIEVGMRRSEVRRLLGRAGQKVPFYGIVGVEVEFESWDGITGEVSVFFDEKDQVEKKDWRSTPLLGRLRRWLRL
jgi:hypothetical protein